DKLCTMLRSTTSPRPALSLHDALPIYHRRGHEHRIGHRPAVDLDVTDQRTDAHSHREQVEHRLEEPGDERAPVGPRGREVAFDRSEEHTSELQSRFDIVCRLLLEKKQN